MTGRQLRNLLHKHDLTQTRAAELTGLGRRTMARYCSGEVEVPKVVELALRYLCEHLPADEGASAR